MHRLCDMAPDLLQKYDDRYTGARKRVVSALSGDDTSRSGILLRWMTSSGINTYSVFSHRDHADAFSSAEGAATLLNWIEYAVEEDKICFPKTENHGPYLHLGCNERDPEAPELFMAAIVSHGHGQDVIDGHRVTGFCADIHEFITAFEAHENEMRELAREFIESGMGL